MNRKYTEAEQQSLIERYLSGESVLSILEETAIPRSTLYSWIKIYRNKQQTGKQKAVNLTNFCLWENKVKRLEGIIEILKTAKCSPTAPLEEKLIALENLYGQYNVHMLCEAMDVSRGAFYNHILRNKRDNTYYSKR
jgi:transposase-like protein